MWTLSLANETWNQNRFASINSYIPSADSEVCYWYRFSLLVPSEGSLLAPESRAHLSNDCIRKPCRNENTNLSTIEGQVVESYTCIPLQ